MKVEMKQEKLLYSRRDLRELFGATNYAVRKLIADGILEEPFNKDKKGEHPRWTASQVRRARLILDERAAPPVVQTDAPRIVFSKRTMEKIRRAAMRASL